MSSSSRRTRVSRRKAVLSVLDRETLAVVHGGIDLGGFTVQELASGGAVTVGLASWVYAGGRLLLDRLKPTRR